MTVMMTRILRTWPTGTSCSMTLMTLMANGIRLAGVDLENTEEVWALLSKEERKQFDELVKSGRDRAPSCGGF